MGPYKLFLAASLPTFICAHRRLRLHCCLTTSLSFTTALMPTCGKLPPSHSCGILLLQSTTQWETKTCLYSCGIIADLLRHHRQLVAASSPTYICAHRRLGLHCCLYHAASWKAVRDHYKVVLVTSLPTFICAHRRLRLHCHRTTSLSIIAALMPTCG
jgi:hypothetical protein